MRLNRSRSERRFLPQCEPLGERIVPAVSFGFNPGNGALLLQGNNKNENFYINDPGDGNLRVEATGMGVIFVNGVKSIQILAGGNARSSHTARQADQPDEHRADMADGGDKFTIEFGGRELDAGIAQGSTWGARRPDLHEQHRTDECRSSVQLRIERQRQQRPDQCQSARQGLRECEFFLNGNQDFDKSFFTANNDVDVRAGARLTVRADDDCQYNSRGEIDGVLEIFLKGPSNEDTFSAQVFIAPDTNGIAGILGGFVNGGGDEDKLTFKVDSRAGAFTILSGLTINGEGGRDKCTFSQHRPVWVREAANRLSGDNGAILNLS
jgi:hypothetical protein